MTLESYSALAKRTVNNAMKYDDIINHALFGMTSEVGEIASIFQHKLQDNESVNVSKLVDECGDLMWFINELCLCFGIPLERVCVNNIGKLMKRYPNGFEEERSKHRHEYGED